MLSRPRGIRQAFPGIVALILNSPERFQMRSGATVLSFVWGSAANDGAWIHHF
jgi:hypothetical protein